MKHLFIFGWVLIGLGFVMQILVPLHVFDTQGFRLLGIPEDITAFFTSTLTILVGIVSLYYGYYREKADRLDAGF